jgi:hypothetical protein
VPEVATELPGYPGILRIRLQGIVHPIG